MIANKDEELADLINDETLLEWDDLKGVIPEMPTQELIEVRMEKVDEKGNVIGFSILKVSALTEKKPLSVSLKSPAVT